MFFWVLNYVTIGIGLVPSPCAFDNFAYMRILRCPAKFHANLFAGSNEHCGIARMALPNFCADRFSRYLACGVDDLLDAETLTIP